MLDDLAALLRALGLGDHARPETPHFVMLSAIAEVVALRDRLVKAKGALLDCWDVMDASKDRRERELARKMRAALPYCAEATK